MPLIAAPTVGQMEESTDFLLLAGSAEARDIAEALVAQGIGVKVLKTEPPRGPSPMPVPFEVVPEISREAVIGAAAGAKGILDASHGFDGASTAAGSAAARALGLPFVTLSRAEWETQGHENWHRAVDVVAAMGLIAPGARVFSTAGWASLADCADFPGACLMLRQTQVHARVPPFDFVELVFGTPPFTAADEERLFAARRVDTLMARNLGGVPSRPKLDAAEALGLKVILIDRPALPAGVQVVGTVEEALSWATAQ